MSEDPLIGRQLANFRIERVLGRGGMAQVYYGWDVKLERPVAIKIIDARYRGNPVYAQRFVREAQSVAAWRHENIVQVYYADEEDGLYYFVMEHIDGQALDAWLSSYTTKGELPPQDEVLRIGRAVADALDYAHTKGVVHRDVKPANIMLTPEGRVVLADFGLAMDIVEGSLGEVFGSPHYIAPEQARRSSDAVPQSDVYALGVVMYELLTGVVPFDDPSPTSVAVQHITLPAPPPRDLNPDLPTESEDVMLRALRKSPDERYGSAGAFIDALQGIFERAEAEAAPEGVPPLPPIPAAVVAVQTGALDSQLLAPDRSISATLSRVVRRRGLPVGILGLLLLIFLLSVLLILTERENARLIDASRTYSVSVLQTVEDRVTEALAGTDRALTRNAPTATLTSVPDATWMTSALPTPDLRASAVAMFGRDLTATASRWTKTPTPDTQATLRALLTQFANQTAEARAGTLQAVAQTATASAWTDTPTLTLTFTPSITPSPTLTHTPTVTPTPTPHNVLYTDDWEGDTPFDGWVYDPEAWAIVDGERGQKALSALGPPESRAIVMGEAVEEWESYRKDGILIRMRFKIPKRYVRSRVIFGTGQRSYALRMIPLDFNSITMSLYRLTESDHFESVNGGSPIRTWKMEGRVGGWHDMLIWLNDRTFAIYLDNLLGIRIPDLLMTRITEIALQSDEGGLQISDLQILEPEPMSTHFNLFGLSDAWKVGDPDNVTLFNEQGEDNVIAQFRKTNIMFERDLKNVFLYCDYFPRSGFTLHVRDSDAGGYALEWENGHLQVMQEKDGTEPERLGFYSWVYTYSTRGSFAVEAVGARLRIYLNGELYHDDYLDDPPGAGRVWFELDSEDLIWLDDCLLYQPGG